MNSPLTCPGAKPTALKVPISCVRSYTAPSMVLNTINPAISSGTISDPHPDTDATPTELTSKRCPPRPANRFKSKVSANSTTALRVASVPPSNRIPTDASRTPSHRISAANGKTGVADAGKWANGRNFPPCSRPTSASEGCCASGSNGVSGSPFRSSRSSASSASNPTTRNTSPKTRTRSRSNPSALTPKESANPIGNRQASSSPGRSHRPATTSGPSKFSSCAASPTNPQTPTARSSAPSRSTR